MSKVIESVLKDVVERVKSSEFRQNLLTPILAAIMEALFPYLIAMFVLWVGTFAGVAIILAMLFW